ncbi:cytochrome c [Allopusillimonas soli]|uniref:Cytochrome c n=1 Tax=Allopusillimonas soli TaxID=659016 RepID=A0A853F6B2_9BURK|nr:cytochrome c [Allopusillimonas soli]NYT35378.1 cytochrome c [Allopusillimonas soli]TEA75794.1 cytochrome c [Allopusillimonas soli]
MHENRNQIAALLLSLCTSLSATLAYAQGTEIIDIQRGRYLAAAGDCISCHTVKGGKPFAGGYPVETPFGTIYSSNITPDLETGIGNWTRDDFYRAMHEGKRKDGKNLYPACPYPWFTKMTREDVDALKAFLDTVEPVRARPPENALIWPLGWRQLVTGWNLLFFEPGEFVADPDKSDLWNRGAYLVHGLGHCAACHTPKNFLGASDHDRFMQGGDAGESWFAPSLTGNGRDGLGSWSTEDIVQYLKTGANRDTASTGPMTEVIMNSTQHLSRKDLLAMATYLKDIPAHKTEDKRREAISADTMTRGKGIYMDQCMGCHMADGRGQKHAFPPLADSPPIQAAKPQTLIQVVLTGDHMADPPELPTGLAMPGFDWKLDDQQVADVLTYVRNSWGNQAPAVSAEQVKAVREAVHEYGPRYKRLITHEPH